MVKSSSKNLKMDPKLLPELVTLEEAQEYGSLHQLGAFTVSAEYSSDAIEDPDFDPEEFLKKRKIEVDQELNQESKKKKRNSN